MPVKIEAWTGGRFSGHCRTALVDFPQGTPSLGSFLGASPVDFARLCHYVMVLQDPNPLQGRDARVAQVRSRPLSPQPLADGYA